MTGQRSAGVAEALAPVCDVLERDGFVGTWRETDDGVLFQVAVNDADCEDCLAPRPVLEMMVGAALRPTGIALARLDMPSD